MTARLPTTGSTPSPVVALSAPIAASAQPQQAAQPPGHGTASPPSGSGPPPTSTTPPLSPAGAVSNMPSLRALLALNGMSEYGDVLIEKGGLVDVADLALAGEEDLAALGVDKVFHRKRLLRLAQEAVAAQAPLLRPPPPNLIDATLMGSAGAAAPSRVASIHTGGHRRTESSDSAGADRSAAGSRGTLTSSVPLGSRHEGGNHVYVEVLSARGTTKELTEREYYVKISLCDVIDEVSYPLEGTTQRTANARGPMPMWPDAKARVFTNFRSHSLAFELKERHLLSDNKHVGFKVFPVSFFHNFKDDMVMDDWFPMGLSCDRDSESTADIRLRLSVPGGCPKSIGAAFHVKSVVMSGRKVRLNIFGARIPNPSASPGAPTRDAMRNDELYASPLTVARRAAASPDDTTSMANRKTYVTVTLHRGSVHLAQETNTATLTAATDASHLAELAAAVPTEAEVICKERTKEVPATFSPVFDEAMEFLDEATECKYITLKLKSVRTSAIGIERKKLLGLVHLPLQYFLAQRESFEIDQVYSLMNPRKPTAPPCELHVRLQVVPRDFGRHSGRVSDFRRTLSADVHMNAAGGIPHPGQSLAAARPYRALGMPPLPGRESVGPAPTVSSTTVSRAASIRTEEPEPLNSTHVTEEAEGLSGSSGVSDSSGHDE